MYLRKVQVRRWGCHDEVEIGPGPGLNVIVGPNGVGKSTLFAAIRIALTFKHNSTDEEVRAHQAWGSDDSGPSATLELARRDGHWRVRKTYLVEPHCVLERSEGDGWKPHSRAKVAELALEDWLNADGASGRLSLRLWSPQDLSIQVLDASGNARAASPASILDRIFALAGPDGDAGPFASVKKTVAEHYEKTFSKIEKVVRRNSDLDLAARAFREAEESYLALKERRRELSEKVDAYSRRRAAFEDDCAARERLAEEKSSRDAAAEGFRKLLDEAERAEAEARTASDAFDRERREFKRFSDADAAVDSASKALEDLAPKLLEARSALDRAESDWKGREARRARALPGLDRLAALFDQRAEFDRLSEALDDRLHRERLAIDHKARAEARSRAAAEAIDSARSAADRALISLSSARAAAAIRAVRDARDRLRKADDALSRADLGRKHAERDRLAPIVDRLRAIRSEIASIEAESANRPVPEAAVLETLRVESRLLDAELAALDADALTLRFEPLVGIFASIEADGETNLPARVEPDSSLEARGVSRIVLTIEGIGRVEIGRTSADLEGRRLDLGRRKADLAQTLAGLRASTIGELEVRRKRAELRASLEAEAARLSHGESPGSVADRLESLDRELREGGIDPLRSPEAPVLGPAWDRLVEARQDAAEALAAARARAEDSVGHNEPESAVDLPAAEAVWKASQRSVEEAETLGRKASEAAIAAAANLESAARERSGADRELAILTHGEPDSFGDRVDLEIRAVLQELNVVGVRPSGAQTRASIDLLKSQIAREAEQSRRALDDASRAFDELDGRKHATLGRLEQATEHRRALIDEAGPVEPREAREDRLLKLREDRDRTLVLAAYHRGKVPADPSNDAPEILASLEGAERRCRDGEMELNGLLTELEILGRGGIDSDLGRAEERLADARRAWESRRKEAATWALLHHLIAEVEADQAKSTTARIEALAARAVPRLTGGRWSGVSLDPKTLAPALATDEGGLSRKIDRLSRGNREQVALACRLEIGRLLGREFRQMVLLDDPLAHTDPYRTGEALDVLAEAAEDLQVLIFTCHPDRYEPLRRRGSGWFEIPAPSDRNGGSGLAKGPAGPLQ